MPPEPKPPRPHPRKTGPVRSPLIPGYHLLERIGQGTTGTVFRAVQLSLQREVALKVLSPELARQPGFPERFVLEARAAAAVHHPNVVTCFDVGECDGVLYQALELMSGGDLERLLAAHGGRLAFSQALAIVLDCARGLEGIHRAGLVHGDIKPANVFIAEGERAKLADLGLARTLGGVQGADGGAREPSGAATIAPEQLARAVDSDIRTDIYALGAMLFILVTGAAPFAAVDPRALARMIREEPPPDPRRYRSGLTAGLAAVIAMAMAKDPARRYATPAQMREDLERLQYDFSPVHAHEEPGDPALPMVPDDQPRGEAPGAAMPDRDPPIRSPTTTIEKDAAFFVVPRALPRRGWRIAAIATAGAAALAGMVSLTLLRPAIAPTATASATPTAPSWPLPPWAALHGDDQGGRWAELHALGQSFRLRFCPAGSFVMGSPPLEAGRRADEERFTATISSPFWLTDSEVTQAQYLAVTGENPSEFVADARLPVENVTWTQCEAFLHRLDAIQPGAHPRLPTEAEWEYACRAGGTQPAAGASSAAIGWFADQHVTATQPVKSLRPNAWGLYDMQGNVMEWCQDFYGPYPVGAATDPVGSQGVSRVVRGGAWTVGAREGRAAARAKYLPIAHFFHLGFRFAISG
jgi:sulfatase modifying factor 1